MVYHDYWHDIKQNENLTILSKAEKTVGQVTTTGLE
jgi:hypothetical protein